MRNRNKVYINPEDSFNINPNLRFKEYLIKDNYDDYFIDDSFEVYYSYQNFNEIMIVSPNKDNEIRIMRLKDKKIIKILKGHSSSVCHVRHFFNQKTKIDYLMSIDDDKLIKIWDLSNNFSLKQSLKLYYNNIYSSILIFDNKNDYIITSTFLNVNLSEDYTKIFSFDGCRFIRNIPSTNLNKTYYLLKWVHPTNMESYIIEFCVGKIIINKVNEEEKYGQLNTNWRFERELSYYRGCLTENNEKLISLSEGGFIHFWDLLSKTLLNTITIENGTINSLLKWSDKYLIISNKKNNSYYIINVQTLQIISKNNKDIKDFIKSFKKIIHPIFGYCLITCNHAHQIQLWTLP